MPELALDHLPSGVIGVAVSGGSDSMALLSLLDIWAKKESRSLAVATVHHHLRDEADAEIDLVAARCHDLGWPHSVLHWRNWKGQGNLQDAARRARYQRLAAWGKELGLGAIALGHTADDQAETFLMRLARGSGVDGLSGMETNVTRNNMVWLRPMLTLWRSDLRQYLQDQNLSWAEDSSNEDQRFQRIQIRGAMDTLQTLGLDARRLNETAKSMQRARKTLELATHDLAIDLAQPTQAGSVLIQHKAFISAPHELQLRVLAHALGWVSGAEYRPRLVALDALLSDIVAGNSGSLSGCLISKPKAGAFEVTREVNAIVHGQNDGVFDGRWRLSGLGRGVVKPLGAAGLRLVKNWKGHGFSRRTLEASPSIWDEDALLAAPLCDHGNVKATLIGGVQSFFTSILTH